MTAIVMGDVNAVCALGCAHCRQMLAARALNERSLLTRGLPFPPTKTIGDVYSDDLVILTVLQFSDVHAASLPIEVRRAPTLCTPSNAHECGQVWQYTDGRVLRRVAGPLGFPLQRRVSLVLTTMLVAATRANGTFLQRLLGRWALALAFRREAFACLDVDFSAAVSLAPRRRCRVNGALPDEVHFITGLVRLLETNLGAEPC